MVGNGGEETAGQPRPSRLRDYLDPPPAVPAPSSAAQEPPSAEALPTAPDSPLATPEPPLPAPEFGTAPAPAPAETAELPPWQPDNASEPVEIARRRSELAALLGEFRRTPVLLPLVEDDAPLVADLGGIRWIYAFSNEEALARFAVARGEARREWPYRKVFGARLLDVGTVVAGVPCGVALDVGSEGEGVLFPPVAGIVPDEAAVDTEMDGEERR